MKGDSNFLHTVSCPRTEEVHIREAKPHGNQRSCMKLLCIHAVKSVHGWPGVNLIRVI